MEKEKFKNESQIKLYKSMNRKNELNTQGNNVIVNNLFKLLSRRNDFDKLQTLNETTPLKISKKRKKKLKENFELEPKLDKFQGIYTFAVHSSNLLKTNSTQIKYFYCMNPNNCIKGKNDFITNEKKVVKIRQNLFSRYQFPNI
jgi:hypothetical protein